MVWSKNRPRAINQGHMRIGSSLQNTSWASALRLFFHVCHMHCHAILVADNTQDPGTEKCKGVQKSTFHLGSWQVTRRMTCINTLCFYGRRVDSLTLIVSNEAYIIRLNRTLHGKLQDGPDGFLFQWLELSRGNIVPLHDLSSHADDILFFLFTSSPSLFLSSKNGERRHYNKLKNHHSVGDCCVCITMLLLLETEEGREDRDRTGRWERPFLLTYYQRMN